MQHLDFTAMHNHWFLLCLLLAIFPRITLAVMLITTTFLSGGFLWWLGFIFTPRLLIAIIALNYFQENPILVILAWIIAFSGESTEKRVVLSRGKKGA